MKFNIVYTKVVAFRDPEGCKYSRSKIRLYITQTDYLAFRKCKCNCYGLTVLLEADCFILSNLSMQSVI